LENGDEKAATNEQITAIRKVGLDEEVEVKSRRPSMSRMPPREKRREEGG